MTETEDFSLTSAGGLEIFARRFKADESSEKARIVFVHGFAEHLEVYNEIFPIVAQAGYTVTVFDQRGHGKTAKFPSEFGNGCDVLSFADIDAVLTSELKDYQGKLFLWGHSMGGGLTLTYMVRGSLRPRLAGFVALSPYVLGHPDRTRSAKYYVGQYMARILPRRHEKIDLKPEWCTNDPDKYEDYRSDPLRHNIGSLALLNDMIHRGKNLLKPEFVAGIEQKPLLLCHGKSDVICWCEASEKMMKALPLSDKKFISYDNLPHELLQCLTEDRDRVLKDIIEWMDEHSS